MAIDVQLAERSLKRPCEPVLDHAIQHLEIAREEDNAGRVAISEADASVGGENLPAHASAFSRKRCSFPVWVLGRASTKSRARGYL